MIKKLPGWEHEGWVGVQHCDVLRCIVAELKARKAPTIFKVADPGSPERALCRQAAVLAKRTARTPVNGEWDLTLPRDTALPRLSLQGNRQRVFYRRIREEKVRTLAPRTSTEIKLKVIRDAAENTFGRCVSNADIWKAVAVKDFLP
jgi:hypothetical protein